MDRDINGRFIKGHKIGLGYKHCLGYKHTEEAKRKISFAHKGKHASGTGFQKGHKVSEEAKKRLSFIRSKKFSSDKMKYSHTLKGRVSN